MDPVVVELFSLFAIGVLVIFLRTCSRLHSNGFHELQADDYLMFLVAILYGVQTVLAYTLKAYWHGLANNFPTDTERNSIDLHGEEYTMRVNGSKTLVASWSTYILCLCILKLAMCRFYLRLMDGLNYTTQIYIGYGMTSVSWAIAQLSILLSCLPIHKNWQMIPDPGHNCQPAISHVNIVLTAVLDVVTNLYIIFLPIPILWRSSLKPMKKVGLMALFSGGLFIVVGGILRGVLLYNYPDNAAQQGVLWACREIFVAVVTTNLPMLIPLAVLWGVPALDFVGMPIEGAARTKPPALGNFMMEDKNPRKGLGAKSPYPLPSLSASEERIYDNSTGTIRSLSRAQSPAWSISVKKEIKVYIQPLDQRLASRAGTVKGNAVDLGDYYLRNQVQPETSPEARRTPTRRASARSLAWSTWSGRTEQH